MDVIYHYYSAYQTTHGPIPLHNLIFFHLTTENSHKCELLIKLNLERP